MRYTLKRRVLGVSDFIEISQDDFNHWKSAQRNIIAAFNIEQTFDLFLENYAEFARDCLDLTDVASWDQTILSVLDRARGTLGEDLSGLAVVTEEKDEEQDGYLDVEWADIFGEPIDWRKQPEAKNRDFSNLAARYVTGYTK